MKGTRLDGARITPRLLERLRRDPLPPRTALLALLAVAVALYLLSLAVGPMWASPGLQVIPLLLGGLLLERRPFLRLTLVSVTILVLQLVTQPDTPPGAIVVVLFTATVSYEFARSREETGLGGLHGDSVLRELQERLTQQGRMPVLPRGWEGDALVLPAGGAPFAGDFVVSALLPDRLEVALVDVSGKGVEAGTRALLLSGALGGLLGSHHGRRFLDEGNNYLLRQSWDEGFATSVHCSLDLRDGSYLVTSAGHPPAAHFDAGSGRWSLVEAGGPALGLLPEIDYEPVAGVLRPGDALLLYTDGLVEVAGRDLALGIDKLLGEAERLVTRGFEGGTAYLAERVAASAGDDRGLVLLWRSRH